MSETIHSPAPTHTGSQSAEFESPAPAVTHQASYITALHSWCVQVMSATSYSRVERTWTPPQSRYDEWETQLSPKFPSCQWKSVSDAIEGWNYDVTL